MTDPDQLDQLDRLLRDVARDRAGDPVAPPNDVIDGLRARGVARRRRRSQLVAVAAATLVVVAGGLVGLARLPDAGTDRVDVVGEPSTTPTTATTPTTGPDASTTVPATTVPPAPGTSSTTVAPGGAGGAGGIETIGPAVGAPAQAYVGMDFVTHAADGQLWTAGGRSLDYLGIGDGLDVGAAGTVVTVVDGEREMLWLLDPGGSPEAGTVVDAVDLSPEAADPSAGLDAGCRSAATGADVVAVVREPAAGGAVTVVQAWTIAQGAGGAAFEPLAAADVAGCTGPAADS